MKTYVIAVFVGLLFSECKEQLSPETPSCIQTIIEQNGKSDSSHYFIEIHRYKYQNQYVYLGISQCCDFYNYIFTRDCQIICSPSGGFAGNGDGKCPNFFTEATDQKLIWAKEQ